MSFSKNSNKPLLVLNASAGSGKTFSLVRNYLRLLLSDGEERTDLGQIVAMTFTNKAALEMKTRIMKDLYRLSSGKKEDETFLTDMANYLEMKPEKVRSNGAFVLRKLLHQYENFNVLTIDKFNLKLIRSFSRDLNLPEKFDIVLNETQLLSRAIDELLNTIDGKDQGKMYHLALNFSKKTLNDQSNWDVKKTLLEKASSLTKETFFPVIQSLIDTEITPETKEQWKIELMKIESEFNAKIAALKDSYERSQLNTDDFSGKGTTQRRFLRLLVENGFQNDSDFFKLTPSFINNIEKTVGKTGAQELSARFEEIKSVWNTHKNRWYQLNTYVKQLPILELLRELAISMNSIRDREATILISEFNKLISQLVKNEEAPFIYERLGSRYQHFFLDEFQDTSHLQWMNLVPMVHESLGNNRFNFIVGDPKQSIYRFKNGVAEQFVCLPRIYNPENDPRIELKSEFFNQQGELKPLEFNWRSAQEIVRFNNLFFKTFVDDLTIPGKEFYNELEQQPKGKANGFVKIEYHLSKNTDYDDTEDSDEDAPLPENEAKLLEYVNDCIRDGYQPGDICILARVKADCNLYANALKSKGFQVVSVDSLLTNSDQAVRLLIKFLDWRSNPEHRQRAQVFASDFFHFFDPVDAVSKYTSCFIKDTESNRSYFSIDQFQIKSNLNSSVLTETYSSIYGLLESVIKQLNLNELENSYVHQLLDIAYQYDVAMGPSLEGFLEHYKSEAYRTNVMIPENSAAIKVMTAHKSKGLEFPVVIIPSLNFHSTRTNNVLVKTDDFVIETGLSKAAAQIDYLSSVVSSEKNAIFMDGLNLLYVAFTRPIDRLYAYGRSGKRLLDFAKHFEDVLRKISGEQSNSDKIQITWGTKPERSEAKTKDIDTFQPESLSDKLWFPEISLRNSPTGDEEALTEQLRLGSQFHSIMEESNSLDSAKLGIEHGILTGTISASFKEALHSMSENFYNNKEISKLLSSGKQLNERTLLVDEKTKLRPDKLIVSDKKAVVLDFKTGDQLAKHEKQVSEYAEVLKQMGYEKVEAYLYYSARNELKHIVS